MPVPTIADAGLSDSNRILVECICCGERGLEVFAEAYHNGLRILFRFSIDPSLPQSVQSRIATFYYKLPVNDVAETFPDRDQATEAILSSIAAVWIKCSDHPSIKLPDVVVEIHEDAEHQRQWTISHMSIYEDYLAHLWTLDQVLYEQIPLDAYEKFDTCDVPSLEYHETLEGRGGARLVKVISKPDSFFVYKGLDFVKYLSHTSEFHHWRDIYYHEIRTIRSLPPHPNVIPPATKFVTAAEMSEEPRQDFVCGTVRPHMKYRTLDHLIRRYKKTGERILLTAKAKWCFQLASAIAHTHYVAHTYHMDIKPSHILIDDNLDILLIDWEQSGASKCTAAPEVDGSWDVEKADGASWLGSGSASLVYKKYNGPARRNARFSWTWPEWNVFETWREHYPQALEAAEVYSVGRTMWMMLQQVEQGENDAPAVSAYWNQEARDIPAIWRAIVDRCLETEPGTRITLSALVRFWGGVRL